MAMNKVGRQTCQTATKAVVANQSSRAFLYGRLFCFMAMGAFVACLSPGLRFKLATDGRPFGA